MQLHLCYFWTCEPCSLLAWLFLSFVLILLGVRPTCLTTMEQVGTFNGKTDFKMPFSIPERWLAAREVNVLFTFLVYT